MTIAATDLPHIAYPNRAFRLVVRNHAAGNRLQPSEPMPTMMHALIALTEALSTCAAAGCTIATGSDTDAWRWRVRGGTTNVTLWIEPVVTPD